MEIKYRAERQVGRKIEYISPVQETRENAIIV